MTKPMTREELEAIAQERLQLQVVRVTLANGNSAMFVGHPLEFNEDDGAKITDIGFGSFKDVPSIAPIIVVLRSLAEALEREGNAPTVEA
jgi:actin-like ATPase involved in cell morphogenesis